VSSRAAIAASLVGLAALCAGCAPREVSYRVRLIAEACSGASPMQDVTHLRFSVTGRGIDTPIERIALASERHADLPAIPAGGERVLEVRAYAGDPSAGGRVVSLGRTLPFEVPGVMPLRPPDELVVFLRVADAFAPASLSVSPGTCTHLGAARAGHSATVLPDGRVLIAGGYALDGTATRRALSSAELYDPTTGVFSDAPELGVTNAAGELTATPRALHTATALPDGRVLIAGGERYAAGTPAALSTALVFDPSRTTHAYGLLSLAGERARHGAAADPEGRVLLVGGVDTAGALLSSLEWFNPATAASRVSDEHPPARVGAAVTTLDTGELAVAGGSIGADVTNLVQFFAFDGQGFSSTLVPNVMSQARRAAAVARFAAPGTLLVIGGFSTIDDLGLSPLPTTELIETSGVPTVSYGPTISERGDICAVALPDGRVLTMGGRGVDPYSGVAVSDATVEEITPLSTGGAAVIGIEPLPSSRYQHTCTLLGDGTILVVGGLHQTVSGASELGDAYVFTPLPLK
jgi:hypothetical protein